VLFLKRRIREFLASGVGPLSPEAVHSYLAMTCQRCGRGIPENALLGNAVVASPGKKILFLCSFCRCGLLLDLTRCDYTMNSLDRPRILYEINRYMVDDGLPEAPFQILHLLRGGGGFEFFGYRGSYKRSDYDKSFSPFSHKNRKGALVHGGEEFLKSRYWMYRDYKHKLMGICAECLTIWPSWTYTFKSGLSEKPTFDAYLPWDEERCYRCKLPHSEQYYRRIGFDEERDLFLSERP
jgi:hypothetical protein